MSILDQVTSAVGGSSGGGNLLDGIVGMIGGQGGLGGLISKFTQGGLGDIVGSWVGTGANKPVSADQLTQVIGNDQLQQMAQQSGLSLDDVKAQVAERLPQVVDKLTPQGAVPEDGNILEKGMSMLKGLF